MLPLVTMLSIARFLSFGDTLVHSPRKTHQSQQNENICHTLQPQPRSTADHIQLYINNYQLLTAGASGLGESWGPVGAP